MHLEYLAVGIISVALMGYLFYCLLMPEKL